MTDRSPETRRGTREGPHLSVSPSGDGPRETASPAPRRGILPRLLLMLVVAGGAVAGTWYYVEGRKPPDDRLVLQGNVDVRQVNLAFKVDGRIESLAVDEGDPVSAGQVLAELDPRYFEDELRLARARRDNLRAVLERLEHGSRPEEIAEARAQLAERQAALENARTALERREALLKKGSVTREEYDNARAAFREAEARTNTAEEAFRLAEIGPSARSSTRRGRSSAARRWPSARPSAGWPTAA